jgi:hypothetical protein
LVGALARLIPLCHGLTIPGHQHLGQNGTLGSHG